MLCPSCSPGKGGEDTLLEQPQCHSAPLWSLGLHPASASVWRTHKTSHPDSQRALDWVRVGTSQHSCVQAACGVQQARPGSTEQFPRVVWFGQLPSTSIIVCVYTESWSSVLCGKEGLGRGSMAMLDEIVHRTGPTAAQRAEKDQERHGSRARARVREREREREREICQQGLSQTCSWQPHQLPFETRHA